MCYVIVPEFEGNCEEQVEESQKSCSNTAEMTDHKLHV
jgi:hypothetical protein